DLCVPLLDTPLSPTRTPTTRSRSHNSSWPGNAGNTSTPASSAFAASHLVRFDSDATYLPWLLRTGGTNGALIFPLLVRNHIASLVTGVSSPPVMSSPGNSSESALGATTAPET